jgi:hypothetical protein
MAAVTPQALAGRCTACCVPPVRRPWWVVIGEALVWRPRMRLKWGLDNF